MNLWLGLLMGFKEIWAHKFRSFLTMLGVILGVASLLSMFSLTAGIAKGMREYMRQAGGIEKVNVISQDPPADQEGYADISPGRTLADCEAIAQSATLVSRVTPFVEITFGAITRDNQVYRGSITGCWPDYMDINKHEIASGRNLTHLDVENALPVCLLGRTIVDNLWPDRPGFNPVGETILLNGRPFKVVGSFPLYERDEDKRSRQLGLKRSPITRSGKSRSSRYNPYERKNMAVIIPISTMFQEFKSTSGSGSSGSSSSSASSSSSSSPGNSQRSQEAAATRKLDSIIFQVGDTNRFQECLDQVHTILSTTHRGIQDFDFDTRQEWFDAIEQNVRNTRLSGGIIAGISLLVGGIGITNIMLASITERIREIGVRRAVGAKGRDIFMQIVVESAVIGFIGGILGLFASFGVMRILVMISPAENAPVVELSSVLISFGFAVVIGVLSGLYPALKASRLDPIEALRYG